MNREQLHHAIRTACELVEQSTVIIIGSQSILGSYSEGELPAASTRSMEIDVMPIAASHDEMVMLADRVEGVAGEMSPYDDLHGFHIDGVDDTTAILPAGWRDRLIPVSGPATTSIVTGDIYTGLCLDRRTCVSRSCARTGPRTWSSCEHSSSMTWSTSRRLLHASVTFPTSTRR